MSLAQSVLSMLTPAPLKAGGAPAQGQGAPGEADALAAFSALVAGQLVAAQPAAAAEPGDALAPSGLAVEAPQADARTGEEDEAGPEAGQPVQPMLLASLVTLIAAPPPPRPAHASALQATDASEAAAERLGEAALTAGASEQAPTLALPVAQQARGSAAREPTAQGVASAPTVTHSIKSESAAAAAVPASPSVPRADDGPVAEAPKPPLAPEARPAAPQSRPEGRPAEVHAAPGLKVAAAATRSAPPKPAVETATTAAEASDASVPDAKGREASPAPPVAPRASPALGPPQAAAASPAPAQGEPDLPTPGSPPAAAPADLPEQARPSPAVAQAPPPKPETPADTGIVSPPRSAREPEPPRSARARASQASPTAQAHAAPAADPVFRPAGSAPVQPVAAGAPEDADAQAFEAGADLAREGASELPEPHAEGDGPAAPSLASAAERPAHGAAAAQVTATTASSLAAAMVRKIESKASRFEIELDPAGLGKVKVSVHIDAEGRLAAQLNFERPDAAAALKGRADELRSALQTAGFDLGGAGLSFTSNGDGSGRQAFSSADSGSHRAAQAFAQAVNNAEEADRPPPLPTRRASTSALDLRI